MSNETKKEECYSCGGKGTYSQIHGINARGDFIGDKDYSEKPSIHNYPCKACDGTGLKKIHNSSPHIPTGEDWEKEFDKKCCESFAKGGFLTTDLVGDWALDKQPIKQFIQSLLLSQEKQWKDEMAGKIPKYRSFEESNSVEYYHGRNDFRNEMLSLLSNNQEDK